MIPLACWLAEFVLESFGATQARLKRLALLFVYLAFRAYADLFDSVIYYLFGQDAYKWADYGQRTIQYVLMAVLCVWLAGKILRADDHAIKLYSGVFAGISLAAVVYFHIFPLNMQRILGFEWAMDLALAGLVAVALAMVNGLTERRWMLIAAGIFVQSISDGALAVAQAHKWDVTAYYPIGALLALGVWLYAAYRETMPVEGEIRLELGVRCEAAKAKGA